MIEKILIPPETELLPGDLIELHFRTIGLTWIKAAQIAAIESRIRRSKLIDFVRANYWDPGYLIFTVRVLKSNPVVLTVAAVAGIIAGATVIVGGIAWVLLDKTYKIIETPAGQIALGGMGAAGVVAAILGLLMLLPKGRASAK